MKGNPGSVGASILLSEEVGHYMGGTRIAIGEMENTQSSIYRESFAFGAPWDLWEGTRNQVLLAILAPVSIIINEFV